MSILAKISITCFAASYIVALALEVSRLLFRSGVRGALMLGFGGAGFIAQTLYLGYRATIETGTPLSSEFDWYLIAAWALVAAYLYLTLYHPRTAFGLFLLPVILVLIAVANFVADRTPFPRTEAAQIWGMIHGIFLLLGIVAVVIGFIGGVMGLVQAWRLKHKRPTGARLRLPSLEWLERTNSRAIMISAVMFGLGFLSGIVLNLVPERSEVRAVPWNDPIIWSSGLLLAWVLVASGFSLFYRPARQGRKLAYLTVASFVFLVLAAGVWVAFPSQHGGKSQEPRSRVQLIRALPLAAASASRGSRSA